MKKQRSAQSKAKEILYVWKGGGIHRVRRPLKNQSSAKAAPGAKTLSPAEQRRYPRLDLKLPILYRVMGRDASRIPSKVRPFLMAESTNISPLGLCLNLSEEFTPGTVLALSIHVVDRREKFNAVGRVQWTQPSDISDHYLTGVAFVVVEGENVGQENHQQLQELIRQLESESPKAA